VVGSGRLCSKTARAAGLREHFEGKTIKIIYGNSPGGGYHRSAGALARFSPDYLPGIPASIIVIPRRGGGQYRLKSLRAILKSKPDGLTLGYTCLSWLEAEAFGEGAKAFNGMNRCC